MALASGTRLGAFEITAPLAAGGMGQVYRARDTRLGRDVAIKALSETVAADPERLARLRREAQTLASLNHANIAAIYGLEEVTGEPYLVLELVEGETLAARVTRGALTVRDTLSLGVQVAAAVEAAHERGIVHRDLKPGNIMITPAGAVKVLDFGIAKSDVSLAPAGADALTMTASVTSDWSTDAVLGTLAYMSPEQLRGRPVDRRSDVWSFGCVLFECLAGRAAFAGETASDVVARILDRDPEWTALRADTPPRTRELLRRCLRKDADARPRDIRDVRIELLDVASATTKAAAHEKAIAVLPFDNLSGPDDEYFADGIADEIMNALASLEGLRVAARTSCFAFKGLREDLRTVGEKLDVTTVLEGSVRRAGSRLRITVQLVNVADGYQLWSERYDREMTDVFEVQEEIARAIATRLRGTIRDQPDRVHARSGTKNLEAYELFLKGRALQDKRGRFLPEAIACFESAIALDPGYAQPMAWLSDSYRLLGTFGAAPFDETMPKAKAMAERALAIDSHLAEAWGTLACVADQYEWRFAEADTLWDRALDLDPRHARARSQRALWALMRRSCVPDDALAEARRAMEDDPLNSWVVAMHSYALGLTGRVDESIREAERALAIDAESFFAHWNLMRSCAWAGQYHRALEVAPSLLRVSGRHQWVLGLLAWTYGQSGQADRARAVSDELEGRSRHEFLAPFWLAVAAASSGQADAATAHLERGMATRDPLMVWTRVIPMCAGLRALTRYEEITREIGALAAEPLTAPAR